MDMEGHRSVALYKGEEAGECEYSETENGWIIYHTGVRPDHEGKSIARRLVFKVLEAAEKNGIRVGATCSYALRVMGTPEEGNQTTENTPVWAG